MSNHGTRNRRSVAGLAAVLAVVVGGAGLELIDAPLAAAQVTAMQASTITVSGWGFGHGVGMSQYGAKGRADAGATAADILSFYYPGTTLETRSVANPRVKLADASQTTLSQAGGTLTGSYNGGAGFAVASGGETVTLAAANGNQVAVFGPGGVTSSAPGELATIDFTQGAPLTLAATGNRYLWGRLVVRATNGSLEIVLDSLTMDQYLRGLGEVPSSWAFEALRAQAIAARSFAAYRLAHPRSPNYDLVATTADQFYVGADKELGTDGSRWVFAVGNTSGGVLTYGGTIIQAFYSSSDGGATETSGYVFATDFPYYQASLDAYDATPANTLASWTRTYSGDELGSWLATAGRGSVGSVSSVSIGGNLGASGRIDRATVTVVGSAGTAMMTGTQFRSAVNAGAPTARDLPSTRLVIAAMAVAPPPIDHPAGGVHNGGGFLGDGSILVMGWAIDADAPTTPLTIHIYVNGVPIGAYTADQARPDMGPFIPAFGTNHGYAVVIPSSLQVADVCAFAINVGTGPNSLLGCSHMTKVPPPAPKKVVKKKVVKRKVVRRR